ncbi:ExbD/TolR family protein [Pseudoalteromonas spongiae]|uniref:ExbD/TolR family protein n=1 Tax=Pseudoalteromonas spongiae TaxID=298657 RepID=UPI000C2D30B8|nr:biopolymer transporter ExbD [Pseudoalteromonas spongiae]
MKKSVRALRMERHHRRANQQAKLSLVSLMDIFTILVFFLIVNSSTVQVLDANKNIDLPKASKQALAEETLVLMVSNKALILQGQLIADLNDLDNASEEVFLPLENALKVHAESIEAVDNMRPLTIMADGKIAYHRLKKIMQTCQQAGFGDLSLAVEQVAEKSGGEQL